MVTLPYLNSLPRPTPGGASSREELQDSLINSIRRVLPEWRYADQGRLARIVSPVVESVWTGIELSQAEAIRFLLSLAVGEDLVTRAADDRIVPFVGESNESLRERVARAPIRQAAGTIASVEENIKESLAEIVEFQLELRPNNQDFDAWVLKAGRALLTDDERMTVSEYVNARDRILAGRTVTVNQVTLSPLDISLTVLYNSRVIDSVTLRDRVNESMREFVDSITIGQTVYVSQITKAALVADTLDATVQLPANDVAGVNGTVHVNNLNIAAAVGSGRYTLTLTEV